jgi:hypothetical protein
LKDTLSKVDCVHGRWQTSRPQCIEAICLHPNVIGFNGYVQSARSTFLSSEGVSLTCNSSTLYDLIPFVDYLVCDNYGQWKPTMPRCYGKILIRFVSRFTRHATYIFILAKCRLPDLGKHFLSYYMDDNTNEWYGKELKPGAFIRHGHSIKYQCQCSTKLHSNCAVLQPMLTQCIDGQWTQGGPQCRDGRHNYHMRTKNECLCLDMSDQCTIPFDIPHLLSNNNTRLNHILNEGESFDYECIHGYARMNNVTCQQGYLTSLPLCEPSNR